MATNTYTALQTQVVTGSAVANITFSGISQSYTDLVLVINDWQSGSTVQQGQFQVGHGSIDTGSNYSWTVLAGNGTSAVSNRSSNASAGYPDYFGAAGLSSSDSQTIQMHFMNYSNTTTYKTILSRSVKASNGTDALVNLWRSTASIDTIKFYSANNIAVGSTFTLYAIQAA